MTIATLWQKDLHKKGDIVTPFAPPLYGNYTNIL